MAAADATEHINHMDKDSHDITYILVSLFLIYFAFINMAEYILFLFLYVPSIRSYYNYIYNICT